MTRWRDRRDERGVVLVVVVVASTALIAISAIVIDLGRGYATARQMQNAADVAALAATRTLDKVKHGAAPASTVASVAQQIATDNGAQASLVGCTIVSWQGNPIGPCQDPAAVTDHDADGVEVSAGAVSPTTFAAVGVVRPGISLARNSAATVQPLIGQDAPLLACAFGQSDGDVPSPDIFLGAPGSYVINPVAIGHHYELHAPDVADCGLPSSGWKGDAGPGPFTLPGWLDVTTGVHAGPIRGTIAGQVACGTILFIGCALVLPVCSQNNGQSGTSGELFCDAFGAFKLVEEKSNRQTFELMGASVVTDGVGGAGQADPNGARVVKLIR